MQSEMEFQQRKAASENRERALRELEASPGDPVIFDDETWLFLESNRRNKVVIEQWDKINTVHPAKVSPK